MPGWDETENEWRFRIREPGLFSKFRYKEISGGVSIIYGKFKTGSGWAVQALRFSKENFNKPEALKWKSDHPDIGTNEAENWEESAASINLARVKFVDKGEYVVFPNVPISASGVINGAWRSPEELRKAIPFMGSLRITIGHPDKEPAALAAINLSDSKFPVIGWTENPHEGPEFEGRARAFADLAIMKKDNTGTDRTETIEDMSNRETQISLGYFNNMRPGSGVIGNDAYSYVETNINPYHLALLLDRPAAIEPPIVGIGCNQFNPKKDSEKMAKEDEQGAPPKPADPAPDLALNELKAQVSALAKEKEESAKKAKELEDKLKAAEANLKEGEKARAELATLRAEERKKKVGAIQEAYGEERFAKLFPEKVIETIPGEELERHLALAADLATTPPEAGSNEKGKTFFALKAAPSAGKNERRLPPHNKGLSVPSNYRPTMARRIVGKGTEFQADKKGPAA